MTEGSPRKRGPLSGTRIIEVGGIGPGPFCGMLLADLGADVTVIDRPSFDPADNPLLDLERDPLRRGKRSAAIDLKAPAGVAALLTVISSADAVIEGFRPGVMERLGLGPDVCLGRRPQLVYGRMTGWGQDGPLAMTAGHDINYLALSGTLSMIGREGTPPVPPLNLVGDFGGGGMLLALGIVSAVLEARLTGNGQIVDASMVDGSALLATVFHGMRATGAWSDQRGTNTLDGGAPFYEVYECADGGYFAVGPVEPRFWMQLLECLGIDPAELPRQYDRAGWPEVKRKLAEAFKARPRDEWTKIFDGVDACATPVLTADEAIRHPHNVHRAVFRDVAGVMQPAPAPRFSSHPAIGLAGPPAPGADTDAVLRDAGINEAQCAELRNAGIISSV